VRYLRGRIALALTDEQLLGEIEDLIRSLPTNETRILEETAERRMWIARVLAAIARWDPPSGTQARNFTIAMRGSNSRLADAALEGLLGLLYEANASLRLSTIGPVTTAIGHGAVFDYFDEIRKLIEGANADLFIIDPYLDADFVSRYMQGVRSGVPVRLLARERISTLLPAIQVLVQQTKSTVTVRTSPHFHDRYIFVDGRACYQSGASFKDGARNAPTTITQITDAFAAVRDTYEAMWADGVQRFP